MLKLLYILAAILILGVIVIAHEFGHYLVGRLCGIGVVEFSVGFGPRLFGWQRKGIQYSVRCLPLGGYCKFVGEDGDNPAPNAMNNQKVWKRFLTVAAGPLMNFVLAYVACAVMLSGYGVKELLPRIDEVAEGMPAIEAGMQAGDIVTAVNGTEISYNDAGAERMRALVQQADPTQPLSFRVQRGGEELDLEILPELVEIETTDPETQEIVTAQSYQIGIVFSTRGYTVLEALRESGGYMFDITKLMLEALKNLFFKGEGIKEVSGPVGMISFMSQQVSEGMYMVLYLIVIISLNLGIMNLLPLPALDGGRLVFLLIEGITRKSVPPEKEGLVHAIGLLLLLGVIVLVTYQDIARLVTGG